MFDDLVLVLQERTSEYEDRHGKDKTKSEVCQEKKLHLYAELVFPISQTPPDLVVDHWTSDVESSSPLDFRLLPAMWTPFGCLMSYEIMSIISVACDFTTKSGGICFFLPVGAGRPGVAVRHAPLGMAQRPHR